ncbi:hypothetical protein C8R43DRAFT_1119210 [Mycena crocata]|nr:hypothetical protein C8R43DRAFT_1119210 [Mycena crocata]
MTLVGHKQLKQKKCIKPRLGPKPSPGKPCQAKAGAQKPSQARTSLLSTAEKRAALLDVEAQIAQYESVVQALRVQQRELENSLKLVVYPVLTLPNEIIARIFVACLPTHGRVRPAPGVAPPLLAQICGHWREVTLATCSLWSSIDLRLNPGGNLNAQRKILLDNWLSRAKGHPVSMTLRAGGRNLPPEFVTSILFSARKLQRLELHGNPAGTDLRQLLPLPQFPTLRCIRTHSSDEPIREIIRNAPALRELGLRRLRLPLISGLELLTHLEIDEWISIGTFIDVVTKLSLLMHLACGTTRNPTEESPTPTQFPQLLSLRLHSNEYILPFITLPRLHRLHCGSTYDSEPDFILSFLTRSACVLDTFTVSFEVRVHDNLQYFLSSIESASLLPRLEHLIISATSQDVNYDDVIDILHARRQSHIPVKLKSFLLKIAFQALGDAPRRSYPGKTESSALEKLIEGRLELGIRYQDYKSVEIWPDDSLLAAVDPCEDFP